MASLIDLRRRLRSVKNTQQITRAMKMVAAAKLRRAQDRAIAARPYSRALRDVLASVAAHVGEEEAKHPLLASREERRVVLLVVAGDKGLAGAFNANIQRAAIALLAEKASWQEVTLLPIGKKAVEFWRRRGRKLASTDYAGIFARVEYAQARQIANYLAEEFTQDRIDAVYAVSNEFKSVLAQVVRVMKILPIARTEVAMADASKAGSVEYIYEPDPATILSELLPRYLQFFIYRILLESAAAEHAARMTAMDSATKNAGEIIDALTLNYNRARQARITKELIEIVSGAAALE